MKYVKNGFFIIEFMTYLVIFGIVSIFFMHTIVQLVGSLKKENIHIQKTISCLNALNFIGYEFANANAHKDLWYTLEKKCVVWHSPQHDKDYCITIQDNKLVKIVGTYFAHQRVWGTKQTTVIIDAVKDLSFQYYINPITNMLTLITNSITVDVGKKAPVSVEQTITFNNRYVV